MGELAKIIFSGLKKQPSPPIKDRRLLDVISPVKNGRIFTFMRSKSIKHKKSPGKYLYENRQETIRKQGYVILSEAKNLV
jgi:hypothetical protein